MSLRNNFSREKLFHKRLDVKIRLKLRKLFFRIEVLEHDGNSAVNDKAIILDLETGRQRLDVLFIEIV